MYQEVFNKYEIAIKAVLAASKEIVSVYKTEFYNVEKEDGSPVTKADIASSEIILQHLEQTAIPITGEEQEKKSYALRQHWKKVWCVDPLDGTKEFIKRNGEFVINIALIESGKSIFGLIASPIKEEIILGGVGIGAYQFSYDMALQPKSWKKIQPLATIEKQVHIISSRSHYVGSLLKLAQNIEDNYGTPESTSMGSALKFFELVNGRADVYPRFAPTMEWDIAAGQAIYEAVGGRVISIENGQPLVYNKENLYNPYFIAYNPYLKIPLEF